MRSPATGTASLGNLPSGMQAATRRQEVRHIASTFGPIPKPLKPPRPPARKLARLVRLPGFPWFRGFRGTPRTSRRTRTNAGMAPAWTKRLALTSQPNLSVGHPPQPKHQRQAHLGLQPCVRRASSAQPSTVACVLGVCFYEQPTSAGPLPPLQPACGGGVGGRRRPREVLTLRPLLSARGHPPK
jgi:hypothetical protein